MIGCCWMNSKILLHWRRVLMIDELPQAAQVIRPMSLGDLAGVFTIWREC